MNVKLNELKSLSVLSVFLSTVPIFASAGSGPRGLGTNHEATEFRVQTDHMGKEAVITLGEKVSKYLEKHPSGTLAGFLDDFLPAIGDGRSGHLLSFYTHAAHQYGDPAEIVRQIPPGYGVFSLRNYPNLAQFPENVQAAVGLIAAAHATRTKDLYKRAILAQAVTDGIDLPTFLSRLEGMLEENKLHLLPEGKAPSMNETFDLVRNPPAINVANFRRAAEIEMRVSGGSLVHPWSQLVAAQIAKAESEGPSAAQIRLDFDSSLPRLEPDAVLARLPRITDVTTLAAGTHAKPQARGKLKPVRPAR